MMVQTDIAEIEEAKKRIEAAFESIEERAQTTKKLIDDLLRKINGSSYDTSLT